MKLTLRGYTESAIVKCLSRTIISLIPLFPKEILFPILCSSVVSVFHISLSSNSNIFWSSCCVSYTYCFVPGALRFILSKYFPSVGFEWNMDNTCNLHNKIIEKFRQHEGIEVVNVETGSWISGNTSARWVDTIEFTAIWLAFLPFRLISWVYLLYSFLTNRCNKIVSHSFPRTSLMTQSQNEFEPQLHSIRVTYRFLEYSFKIFKSLGTGTFEKIHLLNSFFSGYYRVNYDLQNWQLLTEQLKNEPNHIHVLNRAQLIDDSWALAVDNKLTFSVPLSITTYLIHENDVIPWFSAVNMFEYMYSLLQSVDTDSILSVRISSL